MSTDSQSPRDYGLEDLRQDFITYAWLTVEVAEKYLLEIERNGIDSGEDLARAMHDLKGSSGSFGMPAISSMARDVEELLAVYRKADVESPSDLIASGMLTILENMRDALRLYQKGSDADDQSIGLLRQRSANLAKRCQFRVLVLDNTGTAGLILKRAKVTKFVSTTSCRSSLDGLSLLLRENFDVVVTGRLLEPMPSDAVFAALKLSGRQVPPVIALTTDVGAWKSTVVEPYCILARTMRLSEELPLAIDRIVSEEARDEQDPWRIELNSRDFRFSVAA